MGLTSHETRVNVQVTNYLFAYFLILQTFKNGTSVQVFPELVYINKFVSPSSVSVSRKDVHGPTRREGGRRRNQ